MAPVGLAILIGAGPTSGAGIARTLADPDIGNLAVAILARRPEPLKEQEDAIREATKGVVHAFSTDTAPRTLQKTFRDIKQHPEFQGLPLKLSIWHVRHSSKKPFMSETPGEFGQSLQEYTTGAFTFAQESLSMIYETNGGETLLADTNGAKKGTIVFTGTLGALRTNSGYSAYGAGRAGVRMIAQGLAKEVSAKGVHVVHAIANGAIRDEESEGTRTGQRMSAEAVGKTYLWLSQQEPTLWVHELDLRPAQEQF